MLEIITDFNLETRYPEDRRKIVPLRRNIDSRIEPIPFRPEDFYNGGNFVDEIKKTGKAIDI